MSYMGFLDIPFNEASKYIGDANRKIGICKVVPRGRFGIINGTIRYDGLVCSPYDIGGEATGVGAGCCENCKLKSANNGVESDA